MAENHKGMQKIGAQSSTGFSPANLAAAKQWFDEKGCRSQIIDLALSLPLEAQMLAEPAQVLIVKGGVNALLDDACGADKLFAEQDGLEKDTKAFMYGRVVNKHARHNLCFGETHQAAHFEKGEGTVYAFDELPLLKEVRRNLGNILPECAPLQAEGNYYFDINKYGIGYHGDAERKKVIGLRLGATFPLCYRWYFKGVQASPQINLKNIEHGDLYIMSEKASGNDWKKQNVYSLRHAAGCSKYTDA